MRAIRTCKVGSLPDTTWLTARRIPRTTSATALRGRRDRAVNEQRIRCRGVVLVVHAHARQELRLRDGTSYGNLITGITWAVDHGAKVLNISTYSYSSSNALSDAVKYATDRRVVVVAAAANDGCNCVNYPAASPGAIGFAGSNQKDTLYSCSSWGTWVTIAGSRINRDHRAELGQGLVGDSLSLRSHRRNLDGDAGRGGYRRADAVANSGRNA
jgi:Subtilase family